MELWEILVDKGNPTGEIMGKYDKCWKMSNKVVYCKHKVY